MSKYNREFLTDIGNAERAEDATEDFEYDNYDDLDDDALLNKIKTDHGYEDDELDDIYSKWNTDDLEKGAEELLANETSTDTKSDELKEIEPENSENDEDKHTLDSTGTVSDTDDDDWDDVKDTLTNLKGY